MCRLISVIVVVLALASPIIVQYLRSDLMAKGAIPILVNEWKYTSVDDIPDLTGKVVIVTGANVGLGLSSAKLMAMKGAQVVMACRSMDKCKDAVKEIKAIAPKAKLVPMGLDLSKLGSVRDFAKTFLRLFKRLDVLMLNAGIMHPPYALTGDFVESQFQVNHLSHFYLTKLLLPLLKSSQPSTIVAVSSNGHFMSYEEGVKLDIVSLNNRKDYSPYLGYGQSKLCNVLFAQELAERLKNEGVDNVFVNSLNPGGVNTELLRHYPDPLKQAAKAFLSVTADMVFFEPDTAAFTQVYVAVDPEIVNNKISGKYFVPVGEISGTSIHAQNATLQKELWKFSEELLQKRGFA